ncbi:hypothetical protein GQ457_14G013430 [Hibiscus cannabinus]
MVNSPIALERPASPSPQEEQPIIKKNKNEGGIVANFDESAMDAEVGDGPQRFVPDGNHVGEKPDSGVGKSVTYASVTTKLISDGSKPKSTTASIDEEVIILEDDVILNRKEKIPSIQFSNRVHDQVDRSMRNAIIVRLFGRTVGFKTLWSRIHALWKPVGELQLIDLDNNNFLVRFTNEGDYTKVLTQGPWTIFGNYLMVQPWSRRFSTSERHPSQVIVWVRLPGLPFRYYTRSLFRHIADLIGTVVKIDYNTEAGERGKFARLALLVDLSKPLLSCIRIDGSLQRLEYEGLQNICYDCGIYGHSKEYCAAFKTSLTENGCGGQLNKNNVEAEVSEDRLFGPWMVVENRRRRTSDVSRSNGGSMNGGNATGGSRFGVLQVDENAKDAEEANVGQGGKVQLQPTTHTVQPNRGERVNRMDVSIGPTKNDAYLKSNPDKKNKKPIRDPQLVTIIPSLGEKKPVQWCTNIVLRLVRIQLYSFRKKELCQLRHRETKISV